MSISPPEAESIAAQAANDTPMPSAATAEQESELRDAVANTDVESESTPPNFNDMYGQTHPEETPEVISDGLKKLEEEIEKLKAEEKVDLNRAMERCPDLVNEKEKLKFLRCEVFNANLAAIRLARYWKRRVLIFGEKKAFLPLTLSDALKDDEVGLTMGFIRLIPNVKDPVGRAVVFGDPSRLKNPSNNRLSIQRAIWYVIHAALEDDSVQQKGVVMLMYPHNAKFSQIDRKLMKMNTESMKGCIPVRLSAFHICHPPKFFAIIFPLLKLFLGERLRKRIRVHSGSDKKVIEHLNHFGLTKNELPSDLGGDIVLDNSGWLKERKDSGL